MWKIGYASLFVVLAGCAVDASSNQTRDITGRVLGPAEQRDTSAADSQINLGSADFPVKTRRSRELADRYDEVVTFDGGNVRYERIYIGGFSGNTTNIGMIQSVVDGDDSRRQGLARPISELTKVVNRYGVAQYTVTENAQIRCVVFAEHFWTGSSSMAISPGDTQLVGNICFAKSNPRAASIDALTVSLLQNIQLGKGVNAGAATQAIEPAMTPTSPPPSPPLAAGTPTPTAFSVAPIGTRFVTAQGYFQVMRVDGYTVTTVNAGNQTARWIGGLFTGHGGTIDEKSIEALFPLAVGKEITLEETTGRDGWHYTIKVLRSERYSLKARTYQTFVIEVREQSLTPDQGGLDQTRTFWYAPELGGLLRLRTTQTSGPPVRRFNWDVVDIVLPKAS